MKARVIIVAALAATTAWLPAQTSSEGKRDPGVALRDVRGHEEHYTLKGQVTVVMFFSTRCPMSNAFNYRRNVLFHDFGDRVRFLAVDSNVNESLEEVRTYAQETGFDFPVYQDIDNQLADRLGARSTTENFVLDADGTTRYRGYIEDAPNPARTTKQGLRRALDAVLAGEPVATPETHAVGCAIRRKPAAPATTSR